MAYSLENILRGGSVQGFYLLMDRSQANPFLDGAAESYFPNNAVHVIDDRFFARNIDHAPVLIDLSLCPDFDSQLREEWFDLGAKGFDKSIRQGGHSLVSAWLYSSQPVEKIVAHLKKLCAHRHPSGEMHHLRFYDPRITSVLDEYLDGNDKLRLLGPINEWWYPVFSGEYQCITSAVEVDSLTGLNISNDIWDRLDCSSSYHKLIHVLVGLNELHPELIKFEKLPLYEEVYQKFQLASLAGWNKNEEEMIGCAVLWHLLGQDCQDKLPDVANELQQYRIAGRPTLTEWLTFADEAFWSQQINALHK